MTAAALSRQAAQLRAKADRIERERRLRWEAFLLLAAQESRRDRAATQEVRELRMEADQTDFDARQIRREERRVA